MTTEQLAFTLDALDARGAGHRVPILDTPDVAHLAPAWATEGLPAAWWAHRLAHPEVEAALVRLARRLLTRGHRRISIAMIWETLRYETMLGARPDEEPWRLNNSHRAYWSRWLQQQYPDLSGVFEVRASEAERN